MPLIARALQFIDSQHFPVQWQAKKTCHWCHFPIEWHQWHEKNKYIARESADIEPFMTPVQWVQCVFKPFLFSTFSMVSECVQRFPIKREGDFLFREGVFKIRLRKFLEQIVYSTFSSSSFLKSCTTVGRLNYLWWIDQKDKIVGGLFPQLLDLFEYSFQALLILFHLRKSPRNGDAHHENSNGDDRKVPCIVGSDENCPYNQDNDRKS